MNTETKKPNELFTRWHVLEYLRNNERARLMELTHSLGQNHSKIYTFLERLQSSGFIYRKKEKYKNHLVYYFYLSDFASRWLIKNQLGSFMEKKNPCFEHIKKLSERFREPSYQKVGKEIRFIPRKELVGFI